MMKGLLSKLFLLPVALCASAPLMADEGGAAPGGSFSQTLIMIGIAVLFFYFILWRPERKRRKKLEERRSSMKKGDKVTAMGILGVIDRVKEQSVIVKMVDGAKVEFLKAAISEVAAKETEHAQSEEDVVEVKA